MANIARNFIVLIVLMNVARIYSACGDYDEHYDVEVEGSCWAINYLQNAWINALGLTHNLTSHYDVYYIPCCDILSNTGACITEMYDVTIEVCVTDAGVASKTCHRMSIYDAPIEAYYVVSTYIGRVPRYEAIHNIK